MEKVICFYITRVRYEENSNYFLRSETKTKNR